MSRRRHPNILFIMADQFRHNFMHCAGLDVIETPNIDRLAACGVRFTRCCTNSPVCSPARIGLAAGMQPWRFGSVDNQSFLPVNAPNYYKRLRDNGWRVGCIGKLDLAKPDRYNGRNGDRPVTYAYGFTHPMECEGKMHAGQDSTPLGPYGFWLEERGLFRQFYDDYSIRKKDWVRHMHDSVLPADAFEDCFIGDRAAEWIRTIPDDFPWHYFVSFVGPHDPFDPPADHADIYRDRPMPNPIPDSPERKPGWVRRRNAGLTPGETQIARRQYCAAIHAIDQGIGKMLDALEARGQLDNTIIIFSSDHGEMLGDHGMFQKSCMYESALRVPLIVAGPGISGGRTSGALIELIDINPTICELAGLPAQDNIDAVSFAGILRNETESHRDTVISTLRHCRMIRTDRYKLIENYNDIRELYDLDNDPNEMNNIAESEPDIVRRLREMQRARVQDGAWLR